MSDKVIVAGECPKCGSDDLAYEAIEPEDDSIYYPVSCLEPDCDFEGKEYYSVSFDCFYDNNGNEIK
jgi:hypothetical protein